MDTEDIKANETGQKDNVLSGQELFSHQPFDYILPERGGMKDYAPDGSWLQEKHLEKFYEDRTASLREERIQRVDDLSSGEWLPDVEKIQVIKHTGHFWIHMGHVDGGKQFLHPEEALYLMDAGMMEVYYGGVPLSIQQAYATLLGDHVPLEHYQVYSHLLRMGYTVYRYRGSLNVTSYERKIRLDQHVKENPFNKKKRQQKKSRKKVFDEEAPDNDFKDNHLNQNVTVPQKKIKVQKNEDAENKDNEIISEKAPLNKTEDVLSTLEDQNGRDVIMTCEDGSNISSKAGSETLLDQGTNSIVSDTLKMETASLRFYNCECSQEGMQGKATGPPHTMWDFKQIAFPDVSSHQVIELSQPDQHLLPPGVTLYCESYHLGFPLNCAKLRNKGKKKKFIPVDSDLPIDIFFRNRKQIGKSASNWKEYKEMQKSSLAKAGELTEGPLGHLWQGDVTPLLRPEEAVSTAAILDKLKITENVNLSQGSSTLRNPKPTCDLKIVYDVYLPDSKFKKTQPGVPSYRICITRSEDPAPCLADIMHLCQQSTDGAHLLWAVVDCGDIAFYMCNDVSLPTDASQK